MSRFTRILIMYALIILALIICPLIFAFGVEQGKKSKVLQCIEDQVETYGDLCAESASGYEEMSSREAHFEGVRCAAEGIKICLGEE